VAKKHLRQKIHPSNAAAAYARVAGAKAGKVLLVMTSG
jgi:hypothetical protein